jgi:integrase
MFKWAASHEMLPATVHGQLKTVGALRRGASPAVESDPVEPVPIETVEATKPFLSRQVKALVELQLLTGARGGELLNLRAIDIEMDDAKKIWLLRPADHKNAHRGHKRTIIFGPKAQMVIQPFLVGRALDSFLFNPAEAMRERREAATANRKTKPCQGNRPGTNRSSNPKRQPGDHYTGAAYRRAIERACDRATAEVGRALPSPMPVAL